MEEHVSFHSLSETEQAYLLAINNSISAIYNNLVITLFNIAAKYDSVIIRYQRTFLDSYINVNNEEKKIVDVTLYVKPPIVETNTGIGFQTLDNIMSIHEYKIITNIYERLLEDKFDCELSCNKVIYKEREWIVKVSL